MEKFKGPQLTIVLYSFLFIFALSFFYLATTFPVPSIGNHTLGPGFYPSLISAALIVLIATQVVFDLKQNKLFSRKASKSFPWRPVWMFSILAGYAVAMYLIGYLAATILCFALILFMLGVRNWLWYLAAPIFSYGLNVVFADIFLVFLPSGLLFQ
ncbi:tripartite tricarboxylate transporter TctB family protein [Endozoicomonas elysicola]|uniref:DUF1468 domain-containing protein n=1 Tax=Endozoicomonas elysicola TaxID=305900 RepID=A0A081KBF3_9GAMM|nr:tripartite tricarboxylate transporter TctB family protein [Endozoicomonas elysicola]KEI71479.1 hypothetical protein GV64_12660 [Endozoicomonas elysicola]